MDKITIVISSKYSLEEKKDFIQQVKETCGIDCELRFIEKNAESLTKIYSNELNNCKTEIIVFMHDDLYFFSKNWGSKIIQLFNENENYGIIGLAGTSVFNDTCAWWTNEKLYGRIAHKKDGNVWLSEYSNCINGLVEVCMVDGIFMAIKKDKITKNFDTNFKGFHHYDTSFCLDNFVDNACKIGVTTDIHVLHESTGEINDEWHLNRVLLINKFYNKFPIKV